jgi:death-on-curing protein
VNFDYLTTDEVIGIALRYAGDHAIVRNRFFLESAVGQPTMTMFGEDLYPDLASKAAALWYSIDHNQPFMDGNKRTSIMSTVAFLDLNDHRYTLEDDELYDVAMRVATGSIKDAAALAVVLREVIEPI